MAAVFVLLGSAAAQDPRPDAGQDPNALPPSAQRAIDELRREFEAELAELRAELDAVDETVTDTVDRLPDSPVGVFSDARLDFGGHVSAGVTAIDAEDGSTAGAVITFVELYLKATLGENWSLFATPGVASYSSVLWANSRDPSVLPRQDNEPHVFLARAYGEYQHSDALRFRFGTLGTPHGIINREYFIPSRIIALSPLSSRLFTVNSLYPLAHTGVSVGGRVCAPRDGDAFEYEAYLGAEWEFPDEPVAGGRLGYAFEDLGLVVDVNYAHGRRNDVSNVTPTSLVGNLPVFFTPFPPFNNTARNQYDAFGASADLRTEHLVVKAEAWYTHEENAQPDRKAAYVQPTWFVRPDLGLSYRFDYFDGGQGIGIAIEHVVGFMFEPQPNVRFRLDGHHVELPGSSDTLDYAFASFSISF